jgi:ribonuclease HI
MQTAEPIIAEAEVQALIFENTFGGDAIIYTDGSVIRHVRSSWAYTAQVGGKTVGEDSGAFALTTSSMTIEIMAVTRAIEWLETQTFHHVFFLSDSMSMLRKIETVCIRQEWLETIERSSITALYFI